METFQTWFRGLNALELFLGSFAAAFLLQFLLSRVILRLASKTKTDVDDDIVRALRWPLFLSVVLAGSAMAMRKISPPPTDRAMEIIDSVIVTAAVLFWMRALMRIGDVVLDMLARRADDYKWIQPQSLPLFDIASRLLIIGGAIYGVLGAWELDLAPWLASAGIVGIAVGFAAKDTLANLFAGMFIIADAPYKLGDYIVMESGERGRVTDIGIRSTRLLTRDDVEIILPNAVMANSKITNQAGGPYEMVRIRVNVGVAYGSDIDKVRELLFESARGCELLAEDPPPSVRFREFADSALNFQVRGWVTEPALYGRAVDHINTDIYKRFAKAGVEIPFPQRVVHLQKD